MKLKFCISKSFMLFLLLPAFYTQNLYAQFDSLIFSRGFSLDYTKKNIHALGDQNGDGCDDFLIYDCAEQKAHIFFGGNPVDTIPKFSISGDLISFAIIDINDDGIKDVVIVKRIPQKVIAVHYGGGTIDTVPNLIFNPPPGINENNFGGFPHVLNDFNGDGRNELVISDPFLPNSNKPFGCYYFYNTGSVFDTIPEIVMCGDSVNLIRYYGISSSGDINGDGKTDFISRGHKTENGIDRRFQEYYLGNEEWELTPDALYYDDEHSFGIMKIIKDLNKDGRDDILIDDYGFYPSHFEDAILKGSFPIDTIPAWGLNTQSVGINQGGAVSLGDVNGDGFNDFMAPTHTVYAGLKLWVGGRNFPQDNTANKTWGGGEEGFCRDYGAVGDINGDGVDDIAIASIQLGGSGVCKTGRVYIFSGDTTVKADTVTSVKDEDLIPTGYKLYEAYPNPFNPGTVISWQSPVHSWQTLRVYDLLGREVATLLNEEKPAGKYEIEFNADKYNLSSGIYFYRITAGDYLNTKKMLLIK